MTSPDVALVIIDVPITTLGRPLVSRAIHSEQYGSKLNETLKVDITSVTFPLKRGVSDSQRYRDKPCLKNNSSKKIF